MSSLMLLFLLFNLWAIIDGIYSLGVVFLSSIFFLAYMIILLIQRKSKMIATPAGVAYIVGFTMMLIYCICVLFLDIDVKALLML